MKKFSIVLLALLLAGGFAFAADVTVEGEATSSLELDLENQTYGMVYDDDSSITLDWVISDAISSGEGDVYGEISITDMEISVESVAGVPTWTWDNGSLEAKVVGPDWEVIFGSPTGLGNAEAPDMAQDDDDTASYDGVDPSLTRGEGLTINYSDITFGVDFMYDESTTPDLEYLAYVAYGADLADGVSADVAFAVNDGDFFGTAAGAYEMGDLTVDAAFDMEYTTALAWDASLATSYALEDVTLMAAAYYDGAFDVFAKASYAKDALTAGLYGYVSDSMNSARGDAAEIWEVGADASYQIDDVYKAYGEVAYTESATVPFKVGVEAALISNATVDVNYDTSNLGTDLGVVTASVTIEL